MRRYETNDDAMLVRLNDKWSVGKIDKPPQWTLCRRKVVKGKEVWQAVSFCQTKKALLVAINEKVECGAAFSRQSREPRRIP